jgi:hypothetical protein
MNERIRELARQSGLIQYDSDSKTQDAERFAELLIHECAYTARQCYTVRAVDAEDVARHIEETFFGVKQ